jgi:hydrogenase maturation protease
MTAHTLILGLGNPLMADDGAGIQVAELLRQEPLPAEVEIQDGGTAGLGLVPQLANYRRVILIDCVRFGGRPGDWRRFALQETELLGKAGTLSLHHASLRDALLLAEALEMLPPEVIIYGVQPERVEWDHPMSSDVAAALPLIAQAVLDEVTTHSPVHATSPGTRLAPSQISE